MNKLMMLAFVLGVFVTLGAGTSESAFAAEQVCVGGSHMLPTDVDARILAERGTALWYLSQEARVCASDGEGDEQCDEFKPVGSYLELALKQDPQLLRYAFSERIAGRPSARPRIERGGLFQLFRKFVHVSTRQPDGRQADEVRIGRLGSRLLDDYRIKSRPAADGRWTETRLDLWEVTLAGEGAYNVGPDLAMACLRY